MAGRERAGSRRFGFAGWGWLQHHLALVGCGEPAALAAVVFPGDLGWGAILRAVEATGVGRQGVLRIQGGSALLNALSVMEGGKVQLDSGLLSCHGGLEISSVSSDPSYRPALFGANLQLETGQSLANTDKTFVAADGQLTLRGGSLSTPILSNDGVFTYLGGNLTGVGVLCNNPGATMAIGNNAVLNLRYSEFDNRGELTLGGGSATLTGTNAQNRTVTNQGVIRGAGRISYALANQTSGELRAENGNRLLLSGANNWNDGRITLSYGGSVEAPQGLRNNVSGTISGDGVLRTGHALHNDARGGLAAAAAAAGEEVNGVQATASMLLLDSA